jgi:hypothetical protein
MDGPALTGNGIGGGGGSQGGGGSPSITANNASGDSLQFGNAGSAGGGSDSARIWSPSNAERSNGGTAGSGNASATAANSSSQGTAAGAGGSSNSLRPEGYVVGQPAREQPQQPIRVAASGDLAAENAGHGYALRPGEWQPSPDPMPTPPKEKPDDQEKRRKEKKDLAARRGDDWGLKDASRGSVGVTRPIRIECYPDRLVVISDRRPVANKVIPMGPRTESAVDPLIAGVWECMDGWGIAGHGMYWRPILQVSVAPGAEQRYADLSASLENSGLIVERK